MKRHKGCICSGHWRLRMRNYVVTQRCSAVANGEIRPSLYSELKCRQCNKKWRSRAGYVSRLPDYRERTYKKLTYRMVLDLIRDGRLRVDVITGVVQKQRKLFAEWLDVWIELQQVPCKDGYLFVDIKHNNHRRWCAVHRLVWITKFKRCVPKGYDIDHRDRNRANPTIGNLRLRKIHANRSDTTRTMAQDVPFLEYRKLAQPSVSLRFSTRER